MQIKRWKVFGKKAQKKSDYDAEIYYKSVKKAKQTCSLTMEYINLGQLTKLILN